MGVRISIIDGSNEYPLRLFPDTSTKFEHENAIFTPKKAIVGTYDIGFKIPIKGNESIFEFAHHPESLPGSPVFDIRFYSDDVLKFNGKLIVEDVLSSTRIDEGYFDCSVIVDGFGIEIEGKTIRDVVNDTEDLGATSSAIATEAESINNSAYPTKKVFFPVVYSEKFYGDQLEGFGNVVNHFDQQTQAFFTNSVGVKYNICPSVYLLHVLEACFTHFGYTLDADEVFADEGLKKRIVLGMYALDRIITDESFEVKKDTAQNVDNPSEFVTWQEITYDYTSGGVTVPGSGIYTLTEDGDFKFIFVLRFGTVTATQVEIKVSGVSIWIGSPSSNTTINTSQVVTGNDGTDIAVTCHVTGGDAELLEGTTFKLYNIAYEEKNVWEGEFRLGDCLPKTSIGNFLTWVKLTFGLGYFINPIARVVSIRFVKNLIKSPNIVSLDRVSSSYEISREVSRKYVLSYQNQIVDVGGREILGSYGGQTNFPPPEPNKLVYDESSGNYYIGILNEAETEYEWQLFGWGVQEYEVGNAEDQEEEIKIGYKLIPMDTLDLEYNEEDPPDTDKYLVPVADFEGRSLNFSTGKDDWPFHILIAHGMEDGSFDEYPLASSFGYNYSGESLGESMLFTDTDENGIFDKYWDGIQKLFNSDELIVSTIPPLPAEPSDLQLKAIRVRNNIYLVKYVTVSDGNRKMASELGLYLI